MTRYGFAQQEAARSRHPYRLCGPHRRFGARRADLPAETKVLKERGALSRRARDNAFATLDADEIARIEDLYADIVLA